MIYILLVISFFVRLIGINQSLWLDEAITANVVKLPIKQIVTNFSVNDFHPPLYYWFLNVWVRIFGDSVILMRLSSVLFSIITILLVYLIGKNNNKKYGIWAATLVATNPLLIYYSQELRMYSMAVGWLTGAVYFWLKIIDPSAKTRTNWKNILGFNLMTFLAFCTFYGSVFLIGAMMIYPFFTKKYKLSFYCSVGLVVAITVVYPLLGLQLKNSGEMLKEVSNWGLVLGKVNIKNLLLIPLKFSVGKISWYPKINYYIVGGLWTLVVWVIMIKNIFKNKIMGVLLLLPIFLGIVFSIKSPLLQYFRFLYLIPITSLLLAKTKSIKTIFLLAGGFIFFSFMYLLNQNMHREDWKLLTSNLEDKQKIYMISSFADPIKFYNPTIQVEDIKTIDPKENEVVVVPYGEIIHGLDTSQKMESLGYKQTEIKNFREVKLEYWKRR